MGEARLRRQRERTAALASILVGQRPSCTDCRHRGGPENGDSTFTNRCKHPDVVMRRQELTPGATLGWAVHVERSVPTAQGGGCGSEGVLWEQR